MFRKLIKKFNNFRTASIFGAIVAGVSAAYALASFFLYHFAGDVDLNIQVRKVGFTGVPGGQYLGMILFFAAVLTLFTSIYVAYSFVPYIKNKDKLLPRKGLFLTSFITSIFELILFILMVLLMVIGKPNTLIGIIISLPFGLLATIGMCFCLALFLKCDFYMPSINSVEPTREAQIKKIAKTNKITLICALVLAIAFSLIAILTDLLWLIFIFYGVVLLLVLFVLSNKHKENSLR